MKLSGLALILSVQIPYVSSEALKLLKKLLLIIKKKVIMYMNIYERIWMQMNVNESRKTV